MYHFLVARRTGGAMHVVTTRRHYKDTVYETHLLRRTFREDGKVKNETLANLSHLPPEALEAVKRVLHGEHLVADTDAFSITRSLRHGDAAAVVGMARRLGFDTLLEAQRIGVDAGDQRLRQSMSLAVSRKTTARAN